MTNTYEVTITREGDQWLSDVPDVPGAHTYAGSLSSLLEATREVVILMDDLEDDAEVLLHCIYDLADDTLVEAAVLGERRREHEKAGAEIISLTSRMAVELVSHHKVSMRDAAALLGITPGRVSQLARAAGLSGRH